MAASRSLLEALLARVQKRANEPRQSSVEVAPLAEEDIEEYDEELIEIIDDAEVIPQAAAARRAIEPGAFGASLDRRPGAGGFGAGGSAARPAQSPATAPSSSPAVASVTSPSLARSTGGRSAPVEALRPEAVSPRPIAATDIARTQGKRRDLRSTSFIELLDASLSLGN